MLTELRDKKLLVICESPNKVAHIQEYIKKAGYNVRVMASVGHISSIRDGGNYWNTGIDPKNDFKMDLAVSPDKKDVVNKLKAQAEWADLVFIASDGDNEGAQICWSLIKFLKLPKTKVRRMITHEITPKAVVKALENPVPLDTDNAMASQARMCLDKILGYRMSPIARKTLQARSVGRCQTIGLKLIVDREKEIQNFVPETYFDLYVNFEKNKTKFKAKFAGNEQIGNIDHLKSQKEVDTIKAHCTKDYVIEDIKKKEKEESPKPPFCTATYQQEVASKLGLKVKEAMDVAQKLFETGYITYHRSDATDIAPEFIPDLQAYIEKAFGKDKWSKPRVGKKQDNAQNGHECLRITNPETTPEVFNKLNPNISMQKVYKLIWQRTIAAALPNAKISETQYLIDNNGEKFILVSKEITSLGYREVYSYKDDDDKDDSGIVKETFIKGEKLQNCKLEDIKKQTKAPPRYSEATLIKKLETSGVGRPSTYATIVETVLSTTRGYAELQEKSIVPTELGIKLIEYLDKNYSNLINLNYTKEMEKDLDKIAEGKLDKTKFLQAFYEELESTISKSQPAEEQKVNMATDKVCPECGKPMVVRKSKYGLFLACSGYPKCKHIDKYTEK